MRRVPIKRKADGASQEQGEPTLGWHARRRRVSSARRRKGLYGGTTSALSKRLRRDWSIPGSLSTDRRRLRLGWSLPVSQHPAEGAGEQQRLFHNPPVMISPLFLHLDGGD
jgi:hypothetical protein